MAVTVIKTWGAGRKPLEFMGTEADRAAKTDNVPGDRFYTDDEAGSLLFGYLWSGTAWNKFEEYLV